MANPITDTGWKPIENISGGINPKGSIVLATGLEQSPCHTCRFWDKDTKKLARFFEKSGLERDEDGCFITPIVKDFAPGERTSIKVDLRDWGFCRQGGMPSHMNATCDCYKQVASASEMQSRIR